MSSTRMNQTEGPTTNIKKQKVYYVSQTKIFGSLCTENNGIRPLQSICAKQIAFSQHLNVDNHIEDQMRVLATR
jgi:hypothetical protein